MNYGLTLSLKLEKFLMDFEMQGVEDTLEESRSRSRTAPSSSPWRRRTRETY